MRVIPTADMDASCEKPEPSPRIALIAAMARNRVIGSRGAIPWTVPGEQLFFKRTTLGHTVVMGRKTYDSIGRALPGRTNIVISRRSDLRPEGCLMARSLQEALALCPAGESDLFIIGGGQLYEAALCLADRIYLTVIPVAVEGDAFFPEIPAGEFAVAASEHVPGPQPYDIFVYDRVRRPCRPGPSRSEDPVEGGGGAGPEDPAAARPEGKMRAPFACKTKTQAMGAVRKGFGKSADGRPVDRIPRNRQ
jgi:dihydrofolate reductase